MVVMMMGQDEARDVLDIKSGHCLLDQSRNLFMAAAGIKEHGMGIDMTGRVKESGLSRSKVASEPNFGDLH